MFCPRPSLLNAVIGLVNTLINVYTAHGGNWSVTARVTTPITSSCAGVSMILYIIYSWLQYQVEKEHNESYRSLNARDPSDS